MNHSVPKPKRQAKGMKCAQYWGPLKSSYTSPQAAVALKSSAFQPSVCNPVVANDLLLRHMESHYRRVRNAKFEIDSSAPQSWLRCTKVQEQKRRREQQTKHSDNFAMFKCNDFSRVQILDCASRFQISSAPPESDAGFVSQAESFEDVQYNANSGLLDHDMLPAKEEDWEQSPPSSLLHAKKKTSQPHAQHCTQDKLAPSDTGIKPLAPDKTYQQNPNAPSPPHKEPLERWKVYHTRTGRRTAYMMHKMATTGQSLDTGPTSLTPWKPTFSPNSRRSPHVNYPSLTESSVAAMEEGHHHRSRNTPSNNLMEVLPKAPVVDRKPIPCCVLGSWDKPVDGEQATKEATLEDCEPEKREMHVVERREKTEGRGLVEILAVSARMESNSADTSKRIEMVKRRLQEKLEEGHYLRFINVVARDISSRGVLSEAGLAVLFKLHIERNKHQLREDKMWEWIGSLKNQLGIRSRRTEIQV